MLANLTIPVLNRYDLLQRMLDSIDYPIRHLFIIDNGRKAPELRIPDFVEEVTIFRAPSNLGVAESWNLGIKSFALDEVFYFASADMVYAEGDLELLASASPEKISLASSFPYWQTFAIGSRVVERIGLFDSNFYPIYFEDTDYQRRASEAGIEAIYLPLRVLHDNSSTIASSAILGRENSRTFQKNAQYFEMKKQFSDFSPGFYNLSIRKANNWEES